MLTKKYYKLIAEAIYRAQLKPDVDAATCKAIAKEISFALKADNPRFQHERFYNACFPPQDKEVH